MHKMKKILSIIIPTYNMEGYLDKCLTSLILDDESLMAQLEVLVINDGSQDRSSEIAHGYEQRYPQTFRVIDKENGNYGSCINRGLKEATGKYIKVLDADDWFENSCFVAFLNFLNTTDSDLIINDYRSVNENGEIIEKEIFDEHWSVINNQIFNFKKFLLKNNDVYLSIHGVTYKTQILKSIGYRQTEGISYTDNEWIFSPVTKANTAIYFKGYLYNYLLGRTGQSVSPQIMSKAVSQFIKVVETQLDFYENETWDRKYFKSYLQRAMKLLINMIYYYGLIITDKSVSIRKFDCRLHEFPELYSIPSTLVYARLPYVKVWRKHPNCWGKNYIRIYNYFFKH